MEPEDRWLIVWLVDDGKLCVRPDEESRIDAAVQQWLDMKRDTLMSLTVLGDHEVRYLASQVVGWMQSTPERRALDTMQEARDADERRANRQAAGLPFEDTGR